MLLWLKQINLITHPTLLLQQSATFLHNAISTDRTDECFGVVKCGTQNTIQPWDGGQSRIIM